MPTSSQIVGTADSAVLLLYPVFFEENSRENFPPSLGEVAKSLILTEGVSILLPQSLVYSSEI